MGNQPTGGRTMNTRVTTIALTILAGTIAATGKPQGRQRGQRQQRCPARGAPCGGQQGQQFNQGRRRPQQGAYEQQYHHQGGRQQNPQFARQQFQQDWQGQRRANPQQREQMTQKRHQAVLKHFDADGDGQLSKKERQAVRETIKEHRHGKRGAVPNRPEPPFGEE